MSYFKINIMFYFFLEFNEPEWTDVTKSEIGLCSVLTPSIFSVLVQEKKSSTLTPTGEN